MRIGRTAQLTIAALTGAIALVAMPGAAQAEWTAASTPCDVAPGAIFPLPVPFFEIEEPAQPPAGYFTYGADPSEAPPVSQFTAVANWGDGTTSPVTVEDGSVGDCYVVPAPTHTYTSTGTYQFSYTIHDDKTGLDHTLDATQLHIWSDIPHLLGDPSSREVKTTVGNPWSGVVAEFSDEAPTANPSWPYTAEIEWGNGEPSTPGTITPQNGAFTVSGSFTYAHPFSGQITVAISHGTRSLGKWATSSVNVKGVAVADLTPPIRLRLHGRPILAAVARPHGAPFYELVFRTNQPLPETGSGRVQARIEAHGMTGAISELFAHKTPAGPACYMARASVPPGREPKPNSTYRFELALDASSGTRVASHALLRRFSSLTRMRHGVCGLLGCG